MESPSSSPVHPLRIQKGTSSNNSPIKSPSLPRALTDLGPMSQRRNSPSFPQSPSTKKMAALNGDSSPFQSSPFNASDVNSSPRLFWQGRDPTTPKFNTENLFAGREASPSPTRRSSIERLQKASRVKNSNMFAREQKQEYDPASISLVERPLAKQAQGIAYGGSGLDGFRGQSPVHGRNNSKGTLPMLNPTSPMRIPLQEGGNGLRSPIQMSPMKSSLSIGRFNGKASYDSENGTWDDGPSPDERELPPGRVLHRHTKSVTFDAAPPQVNEYELTTPDMSSIGTGSRENSYDSGEEEEEDSYVRGDSLEQDDSFDDSLEDTDKTPVVGPEDWRHASPGDHNTSFMSGHFENPFGGPDSSPMQEIRPSSSMGRPTATRNDSIGSNGEHRPLPPLPGGMSSHRRSGSNSSVGFSAAAERVTQSQRNLLSPPGPSPTTKSEIQGMNGSKMSLEERLQLMMIQDEEKPKTEAEMQRERRMRRGGPKERTPDHDQPIAIHEDEDTLDDLPGLGDYQLPPRISRESILRKVNGGDPFARESGFNFSSPMPSSSPERALDPDTPLPSTEDSILEDDEDSIIINQEPVEENHDDDDVYDIPDLYQRTESQVEEYQDEDQYDVSQESITLPETEDTATIADETDEEVSEYFDPTPTNQGPELSSVDTTQDDGPPTPRAASPKLMPSLLDPVKQNQSGALPEFKGFLSNSDFGISMSDYMSHTPPPPTPPPKEEVQIEAPKMVDVQQYMQRPETPLQKSLPVLKPEYDGTGWGPEEEQEFDAGTPDSVIRHPVSRSPTPEMEIEIPDIPVRESPSIPEQIATIKASGSKLKTRPSATPSDILAMRDIRRQVSSEIYNIPPIPERHQNRPSLSLERELGENEETESTGGFMERHPSFKKRSLTLDIGSGPGLSLDQDFDRLLEAQKVRNLSFCQSAMFKIEGQASDTSDLPRSATYANITPRKQRGYLMRQNTKLVVATSSDELTNGFHGTRSAGNSPVKATRPQSWTVEPWNGQTRKSSAHDRSNPRKKVASGPVPPMPGHGSNATGLGIVSEEIADPVPEEGAERGRLFVKVIGVKDLDLPLPKNEQTWFSLTLDNGVHCVTTAWLELGRNAPIGQEFELVVPNELEFQLTLNAKLVKPAPKPVVESPTKTPKITKQSTFSRVFASPKKRKELEMRQKEEEQRIVKQKQQEAQAKKVSSQPTTWDLLSPLAAEDGSFGRSYVCLKDHETRCYGRPYVVDVACFNEWATEDASLASSVKSKRGTATTQRRAPYKVAKLELQLLFVPKPKGATDDDMPKSMNSCIREMKEAEVSNERNYEGYLSQQGGDCPYWRHRYFKLVGSKLTAYHESTRQPRATINLANASKLIDDRRTLTQKETTGKGGKRRKSGFAEEEEGYMFVEEGFRIRFNNGEIIDFYADTAVSKEEWMQVLDGCIGKEGDSSKRSWCDMVIKREESVRRRAEGTRKPSSTHRHQRVKSTIF